MLGWSFFVLCNSSLSRSIFYMKLGPSKQVWVGRPRGHQCVPIGRGWWWWWLSFLLIFTILFIYSSAGVSISTSIIKYWFYWVLLASFWLLFLLLPWFGFVSAWWEVSEWWTYHVFRHVAICVFIGLITIIIWALRRCSRIYAGFSLGLVNHQNVPDPTLMGIEGCSPQCRPSWN